MCFVAAVSAVRWKVCEPGRGGWIVSGEGVDGGTAWQESQVCSKRACRHANDKHAVCLPACLASQPLPTLTSYMRTIRAIANGVAPMLRTRQE